MKTKTSAEEYTYLETLEYRRRGGSRGSGSCEGPWTAQPARLSDDPFCNKELSPLNNPEFDWRVALDSKAHLSPWPHPDVPYLPSGITRSRPRIPGTPIGPFLKIDAGGEARTTKIESYLYFGMKLSDRWKRIG